MSEFRTLMEAALLKRVQAKTPEEREDAIREMERIIRGQIRPFPAPCDAKQKQLPAKDDE